MAELQMKAVVANGAGGPEVLAIIDRPVPKPSYRQLLIKVAAAAVNGRIVQIAFLNGSTVNIDLMPIMLKRITYTGSTLRASSLAMKTRLVRNLEKDIIPGLKNDDFKPVIFKTFRFEQVKDAHLLMEQSHHIGKIVLIIDPQQIY